MEFNILKNKKTVVILAVIILAALVSLKNLFSIFWDKSNKPVAYGELNAVSVTPLAVNEQKMSPLSRAKVDKTKADEDENEIINVKEMHEQMDREREQQKKIKMLNLELEQIRLQFEREKALSEINKLHKENAGNVKDSSGINEGGLPDVKVLYIGLSNSEKEAILTINGTNYSVKENDRPLASLTIVSITNRDVRVRIKIAADKTEDYSYRLE